MAEPVSTIPNESAADEIARILVNHQIDLSRVEADLRLRTRRELNELAQELAEFIAKRDKLGRALYRRARETAEAVYKKVAEGLASAHARIARIEASVYAGAVDSAIGVKVVSSRLSDNLISTVLSESLIAGAPDKAWWSRQATRTHQRFSDLVRQGMLLGRTTDQMTREWRDIMGLVRRQAEAQVRTGVNTVANKARERMAQRNADVIKGNVVVATLDMRTSEICRARDGMAWDLEGKPLNDRAKGHRYPGPPPYHWNCRSAFAPIVKSFDEITNGKVKWKIPKSTRASMDGQIPADLTYDDWLRQQSIERQKEILGPGKYRLWKRNKLSMSEMVDQTGNPLTLRELERAHD